MPVISGTQASRRQRIFPVRQRGRGFSYRGPSEGRLHYLRLQYDPAQRPAVLSRIRTGAQAGIPRDQRFILLTGHGEAEVVRTAMALDVTGYMVKPVSLKNLVQSVERALAKTIAIKPVAAYQAVKPGATPA
jgi:DNA-binding NarL/FixJ family response regulator